ncbi:MAG TPA: hypothetical protein VMA13_04195, partial [Candidatus Saccharimonadales bacterium]|nr:hypothetical protein [Candidatus Saccharimonadales bacterium]
MTSYMRKQDKRRIIRVIAELHAQLPAPHNLTSELVRDALFRELPHFDRGRLQRISKIANTRVVDHILEERRKKLRFGFVPKHVVDDVAAICGTSSALAKIEAGLWWKALSPPLVRARIWAFL